MNRIQNYLGLSRRDMPVIATIVFLFFAAICAFCFGKYAGIYSSSIILAVFLAILSYLFFNKKKNDIGWIILLAALVIYILAILYSINYSL